MFCNCRFRKPVMLLTIIGMITFVNYTLISWIMGGSSAKDAESATQVKIVPTEKDYPVFARSRGLDDTVERPSVEKERIRSSMRIKSVIKARSNSAEAFYDKNVIEAINQELDEEMLMPPPEAMNFEVPPGFEESEQQRRKTREATNIEFNGFGKIERQGERIHSMLERHGRLNDLLEEEEKEIITTNERLKTLLREESVMKPIGGKKGKSQDALLKGKPHDALRKVKALYEGNLVMDTNIADFIADGKADWTDDEYDPPPVNLKQSDMKANVTGKIEVDLPESAFTSRVFPEGQKLIKSMMKHAWEGYKAYAWGEDDLQPWRKKGMNCLGSQPLGLTITDSLDTLHLMDMKQEFNEGAEWVFTNLDFDKNDNIVSLFETNIRLLGGFLANYALTNDERFLDKAKDLGDRFMKNFSGKTIFPSNRLRINGKNDTSRASLYGSSYMSVTPAQVGTFSLEFGYLSHLTGNPIYREKAVAVIEALSKMETSIPGLYPGSITAGAKQQRFENYSLAGEMDSFYEYLLKYWLLTGKKDELHGSMYAKAVEAIKEHLITNVDGKKFLIARAYGDAIMQQDHLACFAPGMLGLGAIQDGDKELLKLAEELTESCYLSYHQQEHGVGCETVSVPSLKPVRNGAHYILRPEVIESIFYMWRLTKNPKYRRWGYEIALNLEAACKVPTGGYSGLKSVNMTPVLHNDHQESFFTAETLKYLYLLFSEDDLIPLDKWVFNTEAHPLPIMN